MHTGPMYASAGEITHPPAIHPQLQLLDAKGLKRLVLGFLRKHKDNMEARMKHADAPEKFLDSEVDLDEHIKSLLQVWKSGLGGAGLAGKCGRGGGWTSTCWCGGEGPRVDEGGPAQSLGCSTPLGRS